MNKTIFTKFNNLLNDLEVNTQQVLETIKDEPSGSSSRDANRRDAPVAPIVPDVSGGAVSFLHRMFANGQAAGFYKISNAAVARCISLMTGFGVLQYRKSLAALISIIFNETGGRFSGLSEIGDCKYFFEAGPRKGSYNQAVLNQIPAGTYLQSKGLLPDPSLLKEFNGQIWTNNCQKHINLLKECDFYKYRGLGLNQITWRGNHKRCYWPYMNLTDVTADAMTSKQYHDIINASPDLQAKGFKEFYSGGSNWKSAVLADDYMKLVRLTAGVSAQAQDYINNHFLPRYNYCYAYIKDVDLTKI